MGDPLVVILIVVAALALSGAIAMIVMMTRSGVDSKKRRGSETEQTYLGIEPSQDYEEELSEDDEAEEDGNADDESEAADEDGDDEPKLEGFEAKVVSKRMEALCKGTNISLRMVEFFVTFETADGEQKELDVSQKFFDTVKEGDEGTLVLLDGKLFDFGEGEEIPEDAEAEETTETEA